jgi:uncharacterized protein (DUF1697 family)
MTTFIALLRAVNVSGQAVRMEDLRRLLTELGWPGARTLLQTGNIVLEHDRSSAGELERRLSEEIERRLKVSTEVFVRSAAEWSGIVSANPFRVEAESDPSHLVVTLLKVAPRASNWEALRKAIRGPERFAASGRQAYIVYPAGIGRSKLTPALLERSLGTSGTSRNWNTVERLEGMALEPIAR